MSPVTQPGLAQSLQAFYQLAPPKLGVRGDAAMTRERESIGAFHKQPVYLPAPQSQNYHLPRLVAKPSQQTSHALPEPDFTQEKNPTPSLTPNLAISYSTQRERKVNKSVPQILAKE